jgi:predicted ester cyclase
LLGRGKNKETLEDMQAAWRKELNEDRENRRLLAMYHMRKVFAREEDDSVGKRFLDYGPTEAFWEKFPNLSFKLEEQIALEDRVVNRWSAYATTTEDIPGGPPARTEISFSGVTICVIDEDGHHIERDLSYWDASDLLKKMGVLPSF